MLKVDNWRVKLFEYLTQSKQIPFDRDTNNCAHFVDGALESIFGIEIFPKFRKCKTFETQLKCVRKAGFENHVDFLSSIFSELEHYSQAKVGDIAIFNVDDELGVAVGIVFSENCFVMRENGLAIFPLSNSLKVLSI